MFDGLSEETLREAAAELGVPASAVQQAAAEERIGVLLQTARRMDRFVGPGDVFAVRIVDGRRADVMAHADEWLRRTAFRRRRFSTGVAEYSRRSDPVAVAQRAVRSVGGHEGLGGVTRLRVTAEPIGDDVTVLALVAPMETQRAVTLATGSTVAGGGAVASTAFGIGTTPYLLLAAPASVAAGYAILRARTLVVRDVRTTLDGALDRIAAADIPSSGFGDAPQRMLRQAVRVGAQAARVGAKVAKG